MSIIKNKVKQAVNEFNEDGNLKGLLLKIADVADNSVRCRMHKFILDEAIREIIISKRTEEPSSPSQQDTDALVMNEASDIAEELTELECKNLDTPCWMEDDKEGGNGKKLTPIAEEIYDKIRDQQEANLRRLIDHVKIAQVEPEEPRIFEVTREQLQAKANEMIGRDLKEEEIETATNGILSGLEFDIDTVFLTAIEAAVENNK